MKKMILIIGMCIVSLIILIGIFHLLVISGAVFSFGANPKKPAITYGEFPFKLVYEIDGKKKLIEDTIVCEFDGFVNYGTAGKVRRWKTTLKSGNEQLTLLNLYPLKETNELGQTVLELYFYYGTAAYYMGDKTNPFARDAQGFDYVSYEFKTADGKIGKSGYESEEAYKKFNIRLISWEVSEPIQNKFL